MYSAVHQVSEPITGLETGIEWLLMIKLLLGEVLDMLAIQQRVLALVMFSSSPDQLLMEMFKLKVETMTKIYNRLLWVC